MDLRRTDGHQRNHTFDFSMIFTMFITVQYVSRLINFKQANSENLCPRQDFLKK